MSIEDTEKEIRSMSGRGGRSGRGGGLKVAAGEVEAAEARTTPVLALVAESKAYVPHSARTCSTMDRRRPPIR